MSKRFLWIGIAVTVAIASIVGIVVRYPKGPAGRATESPAAETGRPNLPPALLALAREARDEFERGDYQEAEKAFRKILSKAPKNLYSLSNLGVVLFREQKFKLAEQTFKKAIALAPEDGFSHCTLGIVYYTQGNYDDAVNELTKALAINPKNATAHYYLGITASQKGWQVAAKKELETATELDPSHDDSHMRELPQGDFLTPLEKMRFERFADPKSFFPLQVRNSIETPDRDW